MPSKINASVLIALVALTICLTEVRTANAQTPNSTNSAANLDSSSAKDVTTSDVRGVALRVNDKNQIEIGDAYTGDPPDARTAGSGISEVAIWPIANIQRSDGNGNTIVVWPRSGAAVRSDGSGNTIIVWPRSGTVAKSAGNGTTVIVWPRSPPAARSTGNGNVIVVWPRFAPAAKSGGNGLTVLIWPRSAPLALDSERGGLVDLSGGVGITIPPGSLVDGRGESVRGPLQVEFTRLDLIDDAQAGDGSLGAFELKITDNAGRPLNLAPGKTARLTWPVRPTFRGKLPRRTRLFSFNPTTVAWSAAGVAELTESRVYRFTITDLNGRCWDIDNPK